MSGGRYEYDVTCVVCSSTFYPKNMHAKYCSSECRNEARRKEYSKSPKKRQEALDRHRKWANSKRGRVVRARSRKKWLESPEAPWYTRPQRDLPRALRDLNRLYWKANRLSAEGAHGDRVLKVCSMAQREMKTWRERIQSLPLTRGQVTRINAAVGRLSGALDIEIAKSYR